MDDKLKVWTTVGSVGTLNQTDLAKVSLYQSVIQLGTGVVSQVATPQARQKKPAKKTGAAARFSPVFPTIQAVVRYNVTPVDGLFFDQVPSRPFHYGLRLRYLGHVTARLIEVDLATGSETELILFDSTRFAANPFFQVQTAFAEHFEGVLNFVRKAYYVEATLVASAVVAGNPAAISIIKLIAEQTPF
jgi:hypothetical protein